MNGRSASPCRVLTAHDHRALLAQPVPVIALGSEALNDHQTPRTDLAPQLATGGTSDAERNRASPPTLSLLEGRIDRVALVQSAEVLIDQFSAAHPRPPEHVILDRNATDDPVHDKQPLRFFHRYLTNITVSCHYPIIIDVCQRTNDVLKLPVWKLRVTGPTADSAAGS